MGLSIATGLPWQAFEENDELDPRLNATYAEILKRNQKGKGGGKAPAGPQMSG